MYSLKYVIVTTGVTSQYQRLRGSHPCPHPRWAVQDCWVRAVSHLFASQCVVQAWACFLSLARSKLRLCSANHRAGYFSNLACDRLSIVWAYSKQETENWPCWIRVVSAQLALTVCCHGMRCELSRLRFPSRRTLLGTSCLTLIRIQTILPRLTDVVTICISLMFVFIEMTSTTRLWSGRFSDSSKNMESWQSKTYLVVT